MEAGMRRGTTVAGTRCHGWWAARRSPGLAERVVRPSGPEEIGAGGPDYARLAINWPGKAQGLRTALASYPEWRLGLHVRNPVRQTATPFRAVSMGSVRRRRHLPVCVHLGHLRPLSAQPVSAANTAGSRSGKRSMWSTME